MNKRHTREDREYLSVSTAAPGWRAAYLDEASGEVIEDPVVAWAAVRVNTVDCDTEKLTLPSYTSIEPLIHTELGLESAEGIGNFETLLSPDQRLETPDKSGLAKLREKRGF